MFVSLSQVHQHFHSFPHLWLQSGEEEPQAKNDDDDSDDDDNVQVTIGDIKQWTVTEYVVVDSSNYVFMLPLKKW